MEAVAIGSYVIAVLLLGLTFFPFCPMTLKLWMPNRDTMLFAHRNRHALWVLGALGLGVSFALGTSGEAAGGWAWASAVTAGFFVMFWWMMYVPVIMGYPRRQRILTAEEADAVLKPDDDVVGVLANGEIRAYSRKAITRPHLYHDQLGDAPATVTYCILCNSATMFKSELNGQPLRLQPVTAYNNNIIYYDAKSKNYIQQLEGTVIDGPQKGAQLASLPAMITTWQAWKARYPQTTVLHAPDRHPRSLMLSWMLGWMVPLPGLMKRRKAWHPMKGNKDGRLPAMSLVYGVEVEGERKAYPVDMLRSCGVVNDTVGGVPLVVLYDAELDTGGIFKRQVDGNLLSFKVAPGQNSGIVAVDAETGSHWDAMGMARSGPLEATGLTPIPHFGKVFWATWASFRPGTLVAEGAAATQTTRKAVDAF